MSANTDVPPPDFLVANVDVVASITVTVVAVAVTGNIGPDAWGVVVAVAVVAVVAAAAAVAVAVVVKSIVLNFVGVGSFTLAVAAMLVVAAHHTRFASAQDCSSSSRLHNPTWVKQPVQSPHVLVLAGAHGSEHAHPSPSLKCLPLKFRNDRTPTNHVSALHSIATTLLALAAPENASIPISPHLGNDPEMDRSPL